MIRFISFVCLLVCLACALEYCSVPGITCTAQDVVISLQQPNITPDEVLVLLTSSRTSFQRINLTNSLRASTTIPSCIFTSNLLVLDLSNNGLSGSIPTSIVTATNLRKLHLQDNFLTGNIDILLRLTQLTELYLQGNSFSNNVNPCHLPYLQHCHTHEPSSHHRRSLSVFVFPEAGWAGPGEGGDENRPERRTDRRCFRAGRLGGARL